MSLVESSDGDAFVAAFQGDDRLVVDYLTADLLAGLPPDRERRYLPSRLFPREIARELYVSLNTVRTHCKAIYRKLGVSDRNLRFRPPEITTCS